MSNRRLGKQEAWEGSNQEEDWDGDSDQEEDRDGVSDQEHDWDVGSDQEDA